MAEDQIEEIKRKTDIVEIVGEYVELKKAGRNYKGLCPFHSEKSPSFMVSPELQIFKCFGCGVGGDVYKFLIDYEKIEFPQAVKILADKVGIKLQPLKGFTGFEEKEEIYKVNFVASDFYHYLLTKHALGETARDYLKKRGIGEDLIEKFKLGFAPDLPSALFNFLTKKKNYQQTLLEKAGLVVGRGGNYFDRFRARIMFPIGDHYGNTIAFSGRVLKSSGDIAKYINSPDTLVYKKGQTVYGLSVTKEKVKKSGFVVVVEGEFDLLSSYKAGIENIVAIKGSALTPQQAELLSRFTSKVALALDSDFAGDQAARRGIDVLKKSGAEVKVIDLEKYKDPDEFAMEDPEGWGKAVRAAQSIYDFLIESTFAKFDAKTTEGKEKISRELTPILASIEDEIVKAYCVRIVSERLVVPEEAVLAQIGKTRLANSQKEETIIEETQKSRQEILEEKLLGLLLHQNPDLADEETFNLFKTTKAQKIVQEYRSLGNGFTPQDLSQRLPSELNNFFSELFLRGDQIGEKDQKKEVGSLKKELRILSIKDEIKNITRKIKEAEVENNEDSTQELGGLLRDLTLKLSNLEKEE